MRITKRIAVAGLMSILAIAAVPATSADAAQVRPNAVHCCI